MSIIYTLTSHDPSNYGHIKFNASPSVDSNIRYRIKSFSTLNCFSLTTKDDYIIISRNGVPKKYYFEEKYLYEHIAYEVQRIINSETTPELTSLSTESFIEVVYNSVGLISFGCRDKISIIDATHRVKMLLGLYHTKLPMKEDNILTCESMPLRCFGNVLYLRCKSGVVIGTNEGESEQYKNICYKLIEVLEPKLPLISKSPGYLMTSTKEDLSQIEFELVDFMMQPVILHAPLHITLEVYYNGYDLTPINSNEFQYNNLAV